MEATDIFENLLNLIKSSNLNYHLEQSPFAANISLKKSVIKDRAGVPLKPLPPPEASKVHRLEIENGALLAKIAKLGTEVDDLNSDLKQMKMHRDALDLKKENVENNLKKTSCELFKKGDENSVLKKSIKNTSDENQRLKNELSTLNKRVKEKDKVIYKQESKIENLEENFKNVKEDTNNLKQEKKKLEKEIKKLKTPKSQSSATSQPLATCKTTTTSAICRLSTSTSSPSVLTASLVSNSQPSSLSCSPETMLSSKSSSYTLNVTPTSCNNSSSGYISSTKNITITKEDFRDEYNIETNNNFDALAEPKSDASKNIETNSSKVVECQLPKIDFDNYKEAFKDFLETFQETSQKPPKYLDVATKMMQNNWNMFHIDIKDIKKFNRNLGGFLVAQDRNLNSEITGMIKTFIEDLDLGDLNHGLYFNLDR